ncbi:helix-turn-helix domain-containing protein [Mycolicibacterium wolinskyi]|uniref:helix-turn-helix domain-containing protein n=1 Tax=Mycolicibacterium wolinskyi TaxID=59750 RepID=UPI003BAC5183
MHRDEGGATDTGTVNTQFGDLMRERREERGWSQRQLAEMLHAVDLRLDPSAITRIERGTRDVKLTEAIAIASVLEFDLESISFSPEKHFVMREFSEVDMTIRARKALLDALRHIDRWVNNTDEETEDRLIKKRGLTNHVDLYTQRIREVPAFQPGGRLGHIEGDNFAIYYNDEDRAVKQAIVDAVTNGLLLSEDEFDELVVKRGEKAMWEIAEEQFQVAARKFSDKGPIDDPDA